MTELPGRAEATLAAPTRPTRPPARPHPARAFMKRNLLALEEPIRDVARQVFGQLAGWNVRLKEVSSQFTVRC